MKAFHDHEFAITGLDKKLGVSTHHQLMHLPGIVLTVDGEIRVFA
jgi:hypothetical protein